MKLSKANFLPFLWFTKRFFWGEAGRNRAGREERHGKAGFGMYKKASKKGEKPYSHVQQPTVSWGRRK